MHSLCIWPHRKIVSETAPTFLPSFISLSLSLSFSLSLHFQLLRDRRRLRRPSVRPTTCPTRKITPLSLSPRDPRRCATLSVGRSLARSVGRFPGRIITQVLILHCPFLSREWKLVTVTISFDFDCGEMCETSSLVGRGPGMAPCLT